MSDYPWGEIAGVFFFIAAGLLVFWGLRQLSRKRVSTEEEFENRASESASLLGSGINALLSLLDPAVKRSKDAVVEMKEVRSDQKSGEGSGADG